MATYLLVHGGNMSTDTWNRFTTGPPIHTVDGHLGGRVWDPIAAALRASGADVWAPTLHDEHRCDLTDHIEQVTEIAAGVDDDDLVLVGHSYGGIVITGVAARMPERISRMAYVDAALPLPGESLFDIIKAGGVDPFSFEGLEAAAPYIQPLDFEASALFPIHKSYLLCTQSQFSAVTAVAAARIAAGDLGRDWDYQELDSWHVPMADMPEAVTDFLLRRSSQTPNRPA